MLNEEEKAREHLLRHLLRLYKFWFYRERVEGRSRSLERDIKEVCGQYGIKDKDQIIKWAFEESPEIQIRC